MGIPSLQGTFAVGKFGDASANEVAVAVSSNEAGQEGVQVVILDMPAGHQVRRSSFEPDINSSGVSSMIAMQTDAGAPAEICLGWRDGQGPVRCVDGQTFEEKWSGGTLGSIEVLASAELDGDATRSFWPGRMGQPSRLTKAIRAGSNGERPRSIRISPPSTACSRSTWMEMESTRSWVASRATPMA